jgi:hypothetical protein
MQCTQSSSAIQGENTGTRFKEWMNVVGTAVEYAASLADNRPEAERTTPAVSFEAAFARSEASDDDNAETGNILDILIDLFRVETQFTAQQVIGKLNVSEKRAEEAGEPEDGNMVDLRYFCTAPKAAKPSVKAATHHLRGILKKPVRTEKGILSLHSDVDTHLRKTSFYVKLKQDAAPQESRNENVAPQKEAETENVVRFLPKKVNPTETKSSGKVNPFADLPWMKKISRNYPPPFSARQSG